MKKKAKEKLYLSTKTEDDDERSLGGMKLSFNQLECLIICFSKVSKSF